MEEICNKLLIDILNILPNDVECYIQAPSLENSIVQMMMTDSEYDYFKLIKLNEENRLNFLNQEIAYSVSTYIQFIQIKQGTSMLFEGHDGVEFGVLSKNIVIPEWFFEKYIPDTCVISNEW